MSFAEKFASQALSGPVLRDPSAVAERLLAVQGQDPRGVRLAVRARTEGLCARDVDGALTEERSLVISWLNRGTLHLVRSEDYRWLHAMTTPPLEASAKRRLAHEGIAGAEGERAVAAIDRALADEGPLTRLQLRERVESAGVPTARQTLLNLLFLASLRGVAVRGPMVGKEHAYVRLDDWIEPVKPVEREPALAELARRYLAGHAPADDRDLARWAGLPLRDARAGLAAIASELVEREDGLVHLAARRPRPETPSPRLLGAFDPVLLGWTSREPILGPHTHLTTMNGIFRPFAMVEGRAVGGWKLNRGRVEIEPLEPIAKPATAELAADAADVERFIASA